MELINLIGNTPLIKLTTFSNNNLNLYAKLEGQNIGGSVKDRVAMALIEDLEKRYPDLKEKIIIEPSSGNTGIGLAMIGAAKGYSIKIVMPETATSERAKILKFYGAKVEFCPKSEWQGNQTIEKIKQLTIDDPRYVMPNQYENPVCVEIHYKTTGQEIINQYPSITHLVSTMGTGGTITGVAKKLKEYNPNIQIIGVEIKPQSKIPGPRNLATYVPSILDFSLIDQKIMIEDENAVFSLHKKLARQEGIFAGLSSAAALFVALGITDPSSNVVVIFPDKGEKYLSVL